MIKFKNNLPGSLLTQTNELQIILIYHHELKIVSSKRSHYRRLYKDAERLETAKKMK